MTVALAVDYSTTFLKVLDSRLPIFCFFTLKRQKNNHNGKAPKFLIKTATLDGCTLGAPPRGGPGFFGPGVRTLGWARWPCRWAGLGRPRPAPPGLVYPVSGGPRWAPQHGARTCHS